MQTQKVIIRNRILMAATAEFLHPGYQKASLRNIAVEAHITSGNIYRYFKGKSDLYQATVAPAWDGIQAIFKMVGTIHYSDYSENTILMLTNSLTELFIAEQDGFMILIKGDPQSPIPDVREDLIAMIRKSIMKNMMEEDPNIKIDPIIIDTLAISITESMIYIFQHFDGSIPKLKKRMNMTLDLLLSNCKNSLEREIRYAVADPIL